MIAPFPPGYGYGDAYAYAYGTSSTRYTIAMTSHRTGGDLITGGTFAVSWVTYGTQVVTPWQGGPEG
jgi:hypothetical protein